MNSLHVCNTERPYKFISPVPGQEFVVWIMSNDVTLRDDERNEIAAQLVASGCRYAVCSGLDGTLWDDAVDWAYLASSPDFSPADDTFVMTTWHDDESIENIAHYFAHCTHFDDFKPQTFVLLSIGEGLILNKAECYTRTYLQIEN